MCNYKFKNNFFFNILSFLGFFTLVIFMLFYFVWTPEALTYNSENLDPDITYTSLIVFMWYYSIVHIIISLILFVLGLLERFSIIPNFISKIFKTDKYKCIQKIQGIFFWLGIILIPLPIYCFIFIYIFIAN